MGPETKAGDLGLRLEGIGFEVPECRSISGESGPRKGDVLLTQPQPNRTNRIWAAPNQQVRGKAQTCEACNTISCFNAPMLQKPAAEGGSTCRACTSPQAPASSRCLLLHKTWRLHMVSSAANAA